MRTPHLRAFLQCRRPRKSPSTPGVSSDQQAEHHTIDSQLAELTAQAEQDGHFIQDNLRFIDNGHSGASLEPPGPGAFARSRCSSAVDLVYVHAPDRLARSYAHQVLLLEEFTQAGTQVMFLNRPIGTTPEDSLLLQLQGMFAEYERAKVLERSRRGKRHRAQTGAVSVLSRAPFGYRYITREAGGEMPATRLTRRPPGSCARSSLGRARALDAGGGLPAPARQRTSDSMGGDTGAGR